MKAYYGLMAEFANPESLLRAAHEARAAGFRCLDAFTPFPVEGLADEIGFKKDAVATLTFVGGLASGTLGFVMQWYANVIDYPINVGGRPDLSWPAFVPVTFELTVLGAALSAALGMLALNRLPKPWHPAFNMTGFDRASRDRFFLCIQARDPNFDPAKTRKFLEGLEPLSVREVDDED